MKNVWPVVFGIVVSAAGACGQRGMLAQRTPGYLTATEISGVLRVVPAAPATGDARFNADMTIFRETRKLEGSPRWKLAQEDDNLSLAGLLHAFGCALGLDLTPDRAPKLAVLLNRANSDAGEAANEIKIKYRRKRPFQVEAGDVCLSLQGKAALERSPDYPSGHTSLSWETGLVLAELSPDRAADILARARAFGQSRVVCGVHSLSAVEAGWMTASAVFDMQMSSTEFKKDLEAARAEFESLRTATSAKPVNCEVQAQILSKDPY
jgi:acid phosphatase (class A)